MEVIYADSLVLLNAVIDYLLLLSAGKLCALPLRRGRMALGALWGGAYALGCAALGGALAHPLAKLAAGITDTAVTMAVKSHLRGGRPVVLAFGSNDALSASAKNLGELLNRRHYYFVPLYQDAPEAKPRSLAADYGKLEETILAARDGRQIQPIFG